MEPLRCRSAISTSKVLLVPYTNHHVPTYHDWMQDPALQTATASEPLTLDEEYAMQISWRIDHDKLTFIVCLPCECTARTERITPTTFDGPGQMIGDINLFISVPEMETEDECDSNTTDLIGEVELMIARANSRKKGYGRSALLTFIEYILSNWTKISEEYNEAAGAPSAKPSRLRFLRVRINHTNTGSIHLFESLGFQATSKEPNYFGEVELRWQPDRDTIRANKSWEEHRILDYS